MNKYIDAERLKAEIESIALCPQISADYNDGRDNMKMVVLDLIDSLQQEQPAMIQWTGNNLKEVIDFTGKSPRFEEWFKSWEEFDTYVHQHNDILKLFCEDGSHYEIPVGAWIVKTPDGYNLPSVAKYIQKEQQKITDDELAMLLAVTASLPMPLRDPATLRCKTSTEN